MSKVKQWAEDTAEKKVDDILSQLKNNAINKEAAKAKIMNVDNVNMLGIDEHNVGDHLYYAKEEHENKMKTKFI